MSEKRKTIRFDADTRGLADAERKLYQGTILAERLLRLIDRLGVNTQALRGGINDIQGTIATSRLINKVGGKYGKELAMIPVFAQVADWMSQGIDAQTKFWMSKGLTEQQARQATALAGWQTALGGGLLAAFGINLWGGP